MRATIKWFVRDDSQATTIEYGLIVAGISVAAIIVLVQTVANAFK